jgi:hypothetical protein
VVLGEYTELAGLLFVFIFLILILAFVLIGRRRPFLKLREIPAFSRLTRAVGLSVEDGTRLHLSLGARGLTGPESAAAFVGLSILQRVADITSASDNPPIATAGEGALAILAQDTLRSTYQEIGKSDLFNPMAARLTGLTPFSYAAGTLPVIFDEQVSSNLLAGSFADEVALITGASERISGFSLGGTDNLSGQAILYGTAQEPLIGEELYAGSAYVETGPVQTASLHAQDVLRYLIIAVIIGGAVLRFLGVN